MSERSLEITPEELERALENRPKRSLTRGEQDALLEMLEWYEARKGELEAARIRRERWAKRFPLIFAAVSAAGTLFTIAWNTLMVTKGGK